MRHCKQAHLSHREGAPNQQRERTTLYHNVAPCTCTEIRLRMVLAQVLERFVFDQCYITVGLLRNSIRATAQIITLLFRPSPRLT